MSQINQKLSKTFKKPVEIVKNDWKSSKTVTKLPEVRQKLAKRAKICKKPAKPIKTHKKYLKKKHWPSKMRQKSSKILEKPLKLIKNM